MSEQDLLALAERSAENDLAFLLRAKEEAKRRMKDNPSQENINAFNRARVVVETEASRRQAPQQTGRTFKTQLEAVDFLTAQGFKVGKSKFSKDVRSGRVAPGGEGVFEAGVLLAYAATHLTPLARAEDRAGNQAATQKIAADADLKAVQAERMRLKLQKEQGLLMPRAEHEEALAARAQFFKSEVEGFIHRAGADLILLLRGDEARFPELVNWWEEKTAEWMDAWSGDREFGVADAELSVGGFGPDQTQTEIGPDRDSEFASGPETGA